MRVGETQETHLESFQLFVIIRVVAFTNAYPQLRTPAVRPVKAKCTWGKRVGRGGGEEGEGERIQGLQRIAFDK